MFPRVVCASDLEDWTHFEAEVCPNAKVPDFYSPYAMLRQRRSLLLWISDLANKCTNKTARAHFQMVWLYFCRNKLINTKVKEVIVSVLNCEDASPHLLGSWYFVACFKFDLRLNNLYQWAVWWKETEPLESRSALIHACFVFMCTSLSEEVDQVQISNSSLFTAELQASHSTLSLEISQARDLSFHG